MENPDQKAYPQNNTALTSAPEYGGLTKRERFAMAAMQGMNSNPEYIADGYDEIASSAVEQADEILKQLGGVQC